MCLLCQQKKQCPCKPGSVSHVFRHAMSVIYLRHELPRGSSILPSIVYPEALGRTALCDDGIRELAASRRNSPTVTRRLVVSYTTFSPLPLL